MGIYDQDPDVVRWGLNNLVDVCALPRSGSCNCVTRYGTDEGEVGYVIEGYSEPVQTDNIENDAVIAHALQEELSRVAVAEASGFHNPVQESIVAQNWFGSAGRCNGAEHENDECGEKEADNSSKSKSEESDEILVSFSSPDTGEESFRMQESLQSLEIADESALDGEVGKRLNQMIPVPHVPKINGEMPSEDEEISDHQRLLDRLKLYDLVENKVQGDGNCQFRALSDQLYRSPEHHKVVRECVIFQLKSQPEKYDGYVPMAFSDYLKKMSKTGEWGDHVTLQGAADSYGVKIFVLTSFKDTCYIEILPHIMKSERELPLYENRKKKKWWIFGS